LGRRLETALPRRLEHLARMDIPHHLLRRLDLLPGAGEPGQIGNRPYFVDAAVLVVELGAVASCRLEATPRRRVRVSPLVELAAPLCDPRRRLTWPGLRTHAPMMPTCTFVPITPRHRLGITQPRNPAPSSSRRRPTPDAIHRPNLVAS